MATFLALLITGAIAVPLVVPLLLGYLPGLNQVVTNLVYRLGCLGLTWRTRSISSAASWVLRNLCADATGLVHGLCLQANVAADRGRTRAAVRSAQAMLDTIRTISPESCPWSLINTATDVFVNAGLYRKAVSLADDWSPEAREAGRAQDPISHTIAQINRAEALHNLGKNHEALESLEALAEASQSEPIAREGRALLLAWILGHVGRADEGQSVLDGVDPTPLGRRYRAEFLYTQSLIARERGQWDTAVLTGRLGLKVAIRASSRRNGLVVIAAAEMARGRHVVALKLLQAAARQRYRGQSAAGLLLLGALLERDGRMVEARQVYLQALEQDPESALCDGIRERFRRDGAQPEQQQPAAGQSGIYCSVPPDVRNPSD